MHSNDPHNPHLCGAGRAPSPNRLYYTQPDKSRLYTNRYVRRLKAHESAKLDKWVRITRIYLAKQLKVARDHAREVCS